jgi:hypothetical protein
VIQKPIGQPLSLPPEALDQAAVVTPVDVAQARSAWQQAAPQNMADLLDATKDEPATGA